MRSADAGFAADPGFAWVLAPRPTSPEGLGFAASGDEGGAIFDAIRAEDGSLAITLVYPVRASAGRSGGYLPAVFDGQKRRLPLQVVSTAVIEDESGARVAIRSDRVPADRLPAEGTVFVGVARPTREASRAADRRAGEDSARSRVRAPRPRRRPSEAPAWVRDGLAEPAPAAIEAAEENDGRGREEETGPTDGPLNP
jgi:hypothetical protein